MYRSIEAKIDAFLDRFSHETRGAAVSYIVAIFLVLIALYARVLIAPTEAGLPFLTFFPAVTLAAVLGGIGPGVLAMVLCTVIATYLFLPPFYALPMTFHPDVIFSNAVFCMEELIVIFVVEAMYRQRSNYLTTTDLLNQVFTARQELQIAAVAFNAQDGIMITDANGMIIKVNRAFTEMTGYTSEEITGQTPRILKSGKHNAEFYKAMWQCILNEGTWQGEIWDKRKNGQIYPKWMTISAVKTEKGNITHFVSTQYDISFRKAAEEELARMAYFDPLTGLANRRMLHDRLQQEIKKAERSQRPVALLMIDLDRFKEINDTLGHDQGDLLLKEAAQRLLSCVRETDTVARLGGDEFTIISSDLKDISFVDQIAQAVVDVMTPPFSLGIELAYVSASVGITVYPNDATDLTQLFKNADQALYSAKNQGRNCYSYFTPSMQKTAEHRLYLTNALRIALQRNEFEVYYQPIVSLINGQTHKAEALIRWNHPSKGLISPAEFIPLAEETGLIHEIGNWVFKTATTKVKQWRDSGCQHFQVSVNKSPIQFHSRNIISRNWLDHLQTLGLPGECLVVEITESLLMESQGNAHLMLLEYRDEGIQVAIDDFGTGYSSLSYLNKFDIDYLKIDQSFIRNLTKNSSDLALCKAMISMAHELGLQVIAEGVETQEQRDLLAAVECDYGQGYFFAKPMPAEQFDEWLTNA